MDIFSRYYRKQFIKIFLWSILVLITLFSLLSSTVNARSNLDNMLDKHTKRGAAKIAYNIIEKLPQKGADLVIYEIDPVTNKSSFAIFVVIDQKSEKIKIYNFPFRNKIDVKKAEKIAEEINNKKEIDYIKANIIPFLGMIDVVDGIKVGRKKVKMDSQQAFQYLMDENISSSERLIRQSEILTGFGNKTKEKNISLLFPELFLSFYSGFKKLESNLTFDEIFKYGSYFARYGSDGVEIYYPGAEQNDISP